MSEVNYSKKQIQPLVDKFKINVETNTVFNRIIEMFNEQTNYQIWAIKAVFGRQLGMDTLENIKLWSDNNQTMIKDLIKKNIVAYTSSDDFATLNVEMRGLDQLSFVKNSVDKFNTAQRQMLRAEIFKTSMNGSEASNSPSFHRWFELFRKFETLAEHRKKKFISTSSAFTNFADLKSAIETSLTETYDWNKEDLLSYVERNASDCKVVYNEGNVVVLNIPSFTSSKNLGGNGRTGWCLTREDRYFKQYVLEPRGNKQYFLFNFSKKEQDELAYIGFTVNESTGITNAHSTKNNSLLNDGIRYNNLTVNINKALQMSGVGLGVFLHLKAMRNFTWKLEEILKVISERKNQIALVNTTDNRLIVRALNNDGLNFLIGHTLVDSRNYTANSQNNKVYVMFDLNKNSNDDKSVIIMSYSKDNYEMDTLSYMRDAYGTDITKDGYLSSIGVSSESFLNREAINPSILLHKLIDEKSEQDAINLINKQGDEFDVNYEFNQRIPVFSAINNRMFNLFGTIINHKKFNSSAQDGFGEPLLQSLLYPYSSNTESRNKDEEKALRNMIEIIINSSTYDFNAININLDTAINVACEENCLNWIVAKLLENPNVNINVVNDFNCAALGNAIRKKNIEAVKMLGKRPDLVVREEDKELAVKYGINLADYIKPQAMPANAMATASVQATDDYSKVFKQVFAKR